jgi:hypothetical protein
MSIFAIIVFAGLGTLGMITFIAGIIYRRGDEQSSDTPQDSVTDPSRAVGNTEGGGYSKNENSPFYEK